MKKLSVLLLVAIIISCGGCVSQKVHSTENTTKKVAFKSLPSEVYKVALRTALEMDWEITFSEEAALSFGGKTPEKMSRWGDVVNVYISETEEGSEITISSRLGHKPNVDYIQSYIDAISKTLTTEE